MNLLWFALWLIISVPFWLYAAWVDWKSGAIDNLIWGAIVLGVFFFWLPVLLAWR